MQKHVKKTSKRMMSQKNAGHRNTMLFEKAFKCFAAMATICTPMNVTQDFLIDSGAGRNLISQKDLPDQWIQHLGEAPEKLKFATGGGVRNSSQALNLRGQLSGEGVFYALQDCPPAISLVSKSTIMEEHGCGFQVNFRISSNPIDWVTLSIIVLKVPKSMLIVS